MPKKREDLRSRAVKDVTEEVFPLEKKEDNEKLKKFLKSRKRNRASTMLKLRKRRAKELGIKSEEIGIPHK
jgi:predicted transcriptional regulator